MNYEEFKRLAQKIAALMGEHPDSMLGVLLLTKIISELEKAGWKFVPVEPTEAMEMDGKCELIALSADLATSKWAAKKVYEAMVQRAPKVIE